MRPVSAPEAAPTRAPVYCGWLVALALAASVGLAQARALPDFTGLVQENAAAVVNISAAPNDTEPRSRPRQELPELRQDSPFYEFFRRFLEEGRPGSSPRPRRMASLGSGFIISNDGYVITNSHVVEDADEIIVRLNDRREFTAEVIGADERSDIALLKIDGGELPVVSLGSSAALKVGEWAFAIGSPFGFDYSVTQGIISAIGRSLPNENYVPFIQTDVAINPGNSGGPLFNLDGEVIGVNSQIYSRTGGFMGLSFAVPIDVVMNVYAQLRERGYVTRGWLGVLVQDVTRELADSFNMDKPQGALVAQVLEESPAAVAGLRPGDVIVSYNGAAIALSSDLPPLVGSTSVDTNAELELVREGKRQRVQVLIAELPTDDKVASMRGMGAAPGTDNALNLTVRELTETERQRLGDSSGGVVVETVEPGPGAKAGIRRGDVLLAINNVKVSSVAEFEQLVADLPVGRSVPALLQRGGSPMFLALRLEKTDKD